MANAIAMVELPNNEHIMVDPQELLNQLDHRGFNLLMIAAENGRNDEIVRLLNIGFDVNSSIGPHTAASLAYQRRHYDSLLTLLNANSKFPPDFNAESTQHADLIAFDALMNQFQEHLFSEELTELQNIINSHRHLRYFFSSGGHSAAFEALNNLIINCYELFVHNNILLSLDEDIQQAIASLTVDQKEQVRVIHERHAVPLPNNHLMIIHGSIFVGHDINEADRIHRLNTAQNVINFLNEIEQIQPILKLIARAGGFKVIFDFNRENVQFMAPKSNEGSRGLFCTTRHIYIAARNLMNEVNRMEVCGTIAHEFTHFAMDLTYNNSCKPYKETDRDTIGQEFHQILLQSRQQNVVEDIIAAVWRYPNKSQFAELIVRVPHMMAFYANNQVILDERSQQFQPLFNFFTTRVLPDINNKIPTINAEVNQMRADFYDQTLKKVSKLRKTAKILSIFAPIGIIIAALLTYYTVFMPNINFYELSPEDQAKVINGNVKFLNLNLKFHELFNKTNTELLNSLHSNQLRTLMDDETLNLNDQLNKKLQDEIFLIYANMTDSLKQKLFDGSVNFQGHHLMVKQIIGGGENSAIFNELNASQVKELFIGTLSVGKIQRMNTKFYIERDFIEYDIKIDEEYLRESSKYVWTENVLNNLKRFDQISIIANETKMILLSDIAGAGKTTTFEDLTIKLKNKLPDHWIFYIDLKRHLLVYQKSQENIQPKEVLREILSITDEFEAEIFKNLFNSNKTIVLYDGVDEISPKFKEFFINLIACVRNSTNNQQWIATRPQHTKEFILKFKQTAYKLIPYDDDQKIELIENILKNLNVKGVDSKEILSLASDKDNSPLMFKMMTELYVKNKTIFKFNSKYAFYDKIVDLKMEIVYEKGKIVNKDRDNKKAKMTIWEVHQVFALKLIFRDGFEDYFNESHTNDIDEFQLLKRWKIEQSKWTPEAISHYGFLIVDDWNTEREFPDFVHRTFAEFLVARFIIEDLYDLNNDDYDEMSDKDIELRVNLLIKFTDERILSNPIYDLIFSFTFSHEQKKMHKSFTKLITSSEMQNILFNLREHTDHFNLIEILSIDARFLKEFRFKDEKTIFQDYFSSGDIFIIERIANHYERILGANWIHHTGYSINKNFSMPRDEEIDEIFTQDFIISYHNKSQERKRYFRTFFKLLSLFTQEKMPQNDVLNYFNSDAISIFDFSFFSSVLVHKLWETIEIYFNDCKVKLLKLIREMNTANRVFQSSEYGTNAFEFFHKLERFLRSDETIKVDDIRASILNLYGSFYGMKNIIKFYKEEKFTKSEIQQYMIKRSFTVISDIHDSQKSFEDFLIFFKEIIDDENQLRKFLETRNKNNDTVLSYLKYTTMTYSERNKYLILIKTFLIELAKENGISDDDIISLSKKNYD